MRNKLLAPPRVISPSAGLFEENAQDSQLAGEAGLWGCSFLVGELLVTAAFPTARILKIKRLVKDLGGARNAVEIMWSIPFQQEKLLDIGGTIPDRVAELFRIAQVKEKCFS